MDNNLQTELEKKYRIIYIGKQRYYLYDLSKKEYDLEATTPVSLETIDHTFISSSWKDILLSVLRYYLEKYPAKREYFLKYNYPWAPFCPFFEIPGTYNFEVANDLYLKCKLNAVHACWFLRDILNSFDIPLSSCRFILYRPPYSEPEECKNFFKKKTLEGFKFYCTSIKKYPLEKAEQIINNITKLNKYLERMSKSYNDFFLFSDVNTFYIYKDKFIRYLEKERHVNSKVLNISKFCLTVLLNYYRAVL